MGEFTFVRGIYGKAETPELAKEQYSHIAEGGINEVLKNYWDNQPDRTQTVASPSTLTECPRVVWYKKHKVAYKNPLTWAKKQRFSLGRIAENQFAEALKDQGKLLWHWKDDKEGESDKFSMGEDMARIEGTPDLLINLDGKVLISDAKTSRSDSFGYVPLNDKLWDDELWYKYKLQVECYYMLCHKNKDWFQPQPRPWKDVEKELKNPKPGGVVELGGDRQLPLPEACHLFSYALDDGLVRREPTWKATKEVADEIVHYANRWNRAYSSETEPECGCSETQTKFCPYAHQFNDKKLGVKCCPPNLRVEK